MSERASGATMTMDARLAAFLSQDGPEVFHSVEHRHEIWKEDPFDVTTLYADARDQFGRMLERATTPPGLPAGRILLILGESGSGKTHLLRAFRNRVHEDGLGYVGYMQMTTATNDYHRYMLANLIDSLDQPYFELRSPTTSGLARLAHAVASRCMDPSLYALLRDEENLSQDEVDEIVRSSADALLGQPRYHSVDVDLARALLYLTRKDARIKSRALKYLRCEDYPEADREAIGGLPPRKHDDDPFRTMEALGRLVWTMSERSLVLFIDQLEDMYSFDQANERFRRAMSAVCALADRVPSSLFVISCLEDFYAKLKASLTRSLQDRLEIDPAPLQLNGTRTADEVRRLVGKRLAHLYEEMGAPFDDRQETYPFPDALISGLAGLRTRDVLEECRAFHERAVAAGSLPAPAGAGVAPVPAASDLVDLSQRWNDHRAAFAQPRPDDERELEALLGWAIAACGAELGGAHTFAATPVPAGLAVDTRRGQAVVERLLVKVCNKNPRGGHLGNQIAEVRAAADGRLPVVVRSTEFPASPRSKVAEELGTVLAKGGRRAVLEDSACLAMMALREFRSGAPDEPRLAEWLVQEKPLSQMPVLRAILGLDQLRAERAPTPAPAAGPAPAPPPPDAVVLGASDGLQRKEALLPVEDLRMHAAFLGMTGSGKTTLVLGVVEDLVARGIPVVLIDRKGDLAGYARDDLWRRPLNDPAREARRAALHAKIAVALYTPGNAAGRTLSVPLLPDGNASLPAVDRDDEATLAAQALGGMLDYKHTGRDRSCRAVLIQALKLMAPGPRAVTLQTLIELIAAADPALVAAVGRLDTKLFTKLVQDLETLRLTTARLFEGTEPLDFASLLRADGGRTRLSIVSTKFLGDVPTTLFWVAQLLLDAARWTSRHPSPRLQAAILFDEADLYLPATSQPATKQPLENLLRRARSAGLGLLLGTQSPGDLDYKCRDNIRSWFVGRIAQPVAIQKMRPMLADCRIDVASKLPSRNAGQFFLLAGGDATSFTARLPVISPEQAPDAEILALARSSRR